MLNPGCWCSAGRLQRANQKTHFCFVFSVTYASGEKGKLWVPLELTDLKFKTTDGYYSVRYNSRDETMPRWKHRLKDMSREIWVESAGAYTGCFWNRDNVWNSSRLNSHVLACSGYRTPFAVESPFCNTVCPGGGGPKHFPASITNKL
jgi:hypothetical protein